MNKVILVGYVDKAFDGKEAVNFRPVGEHEVISFRMCTYEGKNKEGKALYEHHNIEGWDKPWLRDTLAAGSYVVVDGRLKNDSYERDGRKVYVTRVVAERIETPKADSTAAPRPAAAPRAPQAPANDMPF